MRRNKEYKEQKKLRRKIRKTYSIIKESVPTLEFEQNVGFVRENYEMPIRFHRYLHNYDYKSGI